MTLPKYWALLILAAAVLGILPEMVPDANSDQVRQILFSFVVIVYIPIIAILRMRHLRMTLKEYLLGFIPFYGVRHRFKRITKK